MGNLLGIGGEAIVIKFRNQAFKIIPLDGADDQMKTMIRKGHANMRKIRRTKNTPTKDYNLRSLKRIIEDVKVPTKRARIAELCAKSLYNLRSSKAASVPTNTANKTSSPREDPNKIAPVVVSPPPGALIAPAAPPAALIGPGAPPAALIGPGAPPAALIGPRAQPAALIGPRAQPAALIGPGAPPGALNAITPKTPQEKINFKVAETDVESTKALKDESEFECSSIIHTNVINYDNITLDIVHGFVATVIGKYFYYCKFDTISTIYFLVMEVYDCTLWELLKKYAVRPTPMPMPMSVRYDLFEAILSGAKYIQDQGYKHLDLKPRRRFLDDQDFCTKFEP